MTMSKIEAIKTVRQMANIGLKESKEIVDAIHPMLTGCALPSWAPMSATQKLRADIAAHALSGIIARHSAGQTREMSVAEALSIADLMIAALSENR